jgi:hypothetical protein
MAAASMTTICDVPENYPAEIIAYAEPWIVSPGEVVDIKVCGRCYI